MAKASRDKGARVEREMVERHLAIGVRAERVPLSGAAGGSFAGDLRVWAHGEDVPPLSAEVKARKDGAGFATIERWLGDLDLIFLRRDRRPPLVVLPWETYQRLVERQS